MRVAGLLPWYDEPVEWLQRAIQTAAPLLTTLVAVDGGIRLADTHPRSADDQHQAIIDTCRTHGLPYVTFRPHRLYAGEVQKLNRALQLAAPKADWVMHLHADYETDCPDPAQVLAELDTIRNVPSVWARMHTVDHPTEKRVSTIAYPPGSTRQHPLFYRANGSLGCQGHHARIGHYPRGGAANEQPHHDLTAPLTINHWLLHVPAERMGRKWAYIAARNQQTAQAGGVEA